MALEQAGIDLQAKGFKQYIANLDQIEKKQRQVFEREFKGAGKSFEQVQRAAKSYENQLKSLEKEYNRIVDQEKRLATERQKQATQFLDQQRQQRDIQRAAITAAAALVAREILQFGKESIDLAREQAKAEAQLATAIQSTGGAAQLGSNQLRLLASELQGLTNFGDEATIRAEALLLTFTNIGGDIFPRAVRAIQDVSTAMDQDLNQSAIQVGKALNDPIRGLANLRDVGIQFTAAQEAQIKHFVEVNDLAAAQGVILAELERQFGGSAEAARQADAGITALNNSFGDFKEQVGFLLLDLNKAIGLTSNFASGIDILTGAVRGFRFDLGLSDDIIDQIAGLDSQLANLKQTRDDLIGEGQFLGGLGGFLDVIGLGGLKEAEIDRLNQRIAELEARRQELNLQALAEDSEEVAQAQANMAQSLDDANDSIEDQEALIKALQGAIRQAEQLELSFARAAEDATRRATRQQAKLNREQFKDRMELLNDQAKEFDQFQEDELKSVQEAEEKLNEAKQKAGDEQKREQDKLFRELKQARDRFNLDALQSQRRFDLQDRRLRAAGDILALQELREDFKLQELEAKENFDLQSKQREEDAKDQTSVADERRQEQIAELEQELTDLQNGLDQRRQEFLAAQQEEFNNLKAAQAEQQLALQESLREQEEDRRISQQRQLEDLGRSLAAQEDLTAEGAAKIAAQLEEAFGIEGVADTIMSGFTMRQESAFQKLFNEIAGGIETTKERIEELSGTVGASAPLEFGATGANPATFGIPSFHQGGVVPGPRGSEQVIRALGGETVLPTHQMNAPIVPSQNLNVNMSGGFNISGGEGAGQAATQAAIVEMTEAFEIAVKRLGRRI